MAESIVLLVVAVLTLPLQSSLGLTASTIQLPRGFTCPHNVSEMSSTVNTVLFCKAFVLVRPVGRVHLAVSLP